MKKFTTTIIAGAIAVAGFVGIGNVVSNKDDDVEKPNNQTPDVENVAPTTSDSVKSETPVVDVAEVAEGESQVPPVSREDAMSLVAAISAASVAESNVIEEFSKEFLTESTGENVIPSADKVEFDSAEPFGNYDYSGKKLNESNSHFVGQDLRGANFDGANIEGVDFFVDFSKANLLKANFSKAYLERVKLNDVNLDDANLVGARFIDSDLSSSKMHNVDAFGSTMVRVDLSGSNMSHASLGRADINEVNFSDANLENVNLGSSTITNSDFSNIDDLSTVSFIFAAIDSNTIETNPEEISSNYISSNIYMMDAYDRAGISLNTEEYSNIIFTIEEIGEVGINNAQTNLLSERAHSSYVRGVVGQSR